MGVNLCLALHGDQGELGEEEGKRLHSSRGTSVRGTSGIGWSPSQRAAPASRDAHSSRKT